MKKIILAGLVLGLLPFISKGLLAQHLHWHHGHIDVHENVPHGHDAAGHLVDSMGHHIDGDGHHTGSIGVYEDGSIDGHWHGHYPVYDRHYLGFPTYSTIQPATIYPTYTTPILTSPALTSPIPSTVITTTPSVVIGNGTVVTNKIPLTPGAVGSTATISNPREIGGAIGYTLNGQAYTLRPGETQTIQLDKEIILKFENGLGKQLAYRLDAGNFQFRVSQQAGWSIVKTANISTAPLADTPPTVPGNTIPN
jgi:hypothetical protein